MSYVFACAVALCTIVLRLNTGVDCLICDKGSFMCADSTKCLPRQWRCDGEHDCGDGSDELHCGTVNASCNANQFRCKVGRCLHSIWRCDGDRDCPDGSDEADCTTKPKKCPAEMTRCDNGLCLSPAYICDGDDDCGDKSDERNCSKTCSPTKFQCNNGGCILKSWRCDGDRDCADGSDEKDCPTSSCRNTQFRCANGRCIPKTFVCDGDKDCLDDSDERNCGKVTCLSTEFTCTKGNCILPNWRCDGENDCIDGTDEQNCTSKKQCSEGHFLCKTAKMHVCIKNSSVCNGVLDCPDGSDEKNCNKTGKLVTCKVYKDSNCSGNSNCKDTAQCTQCVAVWSNHSGQVSIVRQGCMNDCKSDGKECVPRSMISTIYSCCCTGDYCNDIKKASKGCPEYKCKNGECASYHSICHGTSECSDKSDETFCEQMCLGNLEIQSTYSPQDKRTLSVLRSRNVLLNSSRSAWCSKAGRNDQWISVDLGKVRTINALVTLGYPAGTEPGFDNFTLQLSYDNITYYDYSENGSIKVLSGNRNPLLKRKNPLITDVQARYLKIFPTASPGKKYACMRFAVLGCDRAIKPVVTIDRRKVTPALKTDGVINCIVRGQRKNGLVVEWSTKARDGTTYEVTSRHFHRIVEKETNDTANSLFITKNSTLNLKYNFNFIRTVMTCNSTGSLVLCSANYRCMAKYSRGKRDTAHAVKTASIEYNLGKPVSKITIGVENITTDSAVLSWKLEPVPIYALLVEAMVHALHENSDTGYTYISLLSKSLKMTKLLPYTSYKVWLSVSANSLPGVAELKSNTLYFKTGVKAPSSPPSLKLISTDTNSAILQCKPPEPKQRNGPIDGYIFDSKRTHIGMKQVDEKPTQTITNSSEIINLAKLYPWSTYNIQVKAFNLHDGNRLTSGQKEIIITTKAEKPSKIPKDFSVSIESKNIIRIVWASDLDIHDMSGPVQGYKVKLTQYFNKERTKRYVHTGARLFTVNIGEKNTVFDTSSQAVLCTVEVAFYSKLGTGPFSQPIMLKLHSTSAPTTKIVKVWTTVFSSTKKLQTTKQQRKDTTESIKTTSNSDYVTGKKGRITSGEDKHGHSRFFYIGFFIAAAIVFILLMTIIILACKMHSKKQKSNWTNNGFGCRTYGEKKMDPFLLDSDNEDQHQDPVIMYSKNDVKESLSISNL